MWETLPGVAHEQGEGHGNIPPGSSLLLFSFGQSSPCEASTVCVSEFRDFLWSHLSKLTTSSIAVDSAPSSLDDCAGVQVLFWLPLWASQFALPGSSRGSCHRCKVHAVSQCFAEIQLCLTQPLTTSLLHVLHSSPRFLSIRCIFLEINFLFFLNRT